MQGRKLHELFFTTVETLYIALYSTGFNQQRMRLPFQYKMPRFYKKCYAKILKDCGSDGIERSIIALFQ